MLILNLFFLLMKVFGLVKANLIHTSEIELFIGMVTFVGAENPHLQLSQKQVSIDQLQNQLKKGDT